MFFIALLFLFQVDLLKSIGAEFVVDSSAETFKEDLEVCMFVFSVPAL